ncbi:unnamed protein product [Adineta steineri]|uniref:Uncharacterized protein n=1 Tax=Adineta steineri TaxID=433720 RepID=A0A815GQ78_9BILA|nr:unnamed protein product [Adineta steineri]CAF3844797.1 unnamed protein product [Adineta steineri]
MYTPIIDRLNVEDRKNFLKVIEYSNLSMNLYGDDELNEACESEMISDLNIILDRKTTSAFFCMVQYYGREHKLCGDK